MPATKATAKRIGISVTAVPRSGWRAMTSSGTAVSAPAIEQVDARERRRAGSSPKNLASTSASAALANSDGCRLNGPRSIQRREPPRTAPKKST